MIKAYYADKPHEELKPFEYDPGQLGDEQVEIKVEYCGICHSDLSMLNNDWAMTQYPFVPGHEVVGTVSALGRSVKKLKIGDRVGVGWYSGSCMTCEWCMSGNHNLCASAEATMLGRYGGFADKIYAHYNWAVPLPPALDPAKAGPLFCGGITVFNPIVEFNIRAIDRVGVIGIGGLGHMALQFLRAWGCDVTAFSSQANKEEEARKLGANNFINSQDGEQLRKAVGTFDFIISTVNADLDWNLYLSLLRPKGRLHFVGVAPSPVSSSVFPLIAKQLSISGSPLGSPATTSSMLEFAARHKIAPIVETYQFSQVNEALEKLQSGKARYRIVLKH